MDRSVYAQAAEIGVWLPHSKGTLEYLKKNNIKLYLILAKIDNLEGMEFTDFMTSEGNNYYSCPFCKDLKLYSAAFGYAKKHFESHIVDIEDILDKKRLHDIRYEL